MIFSRIIYGESGTLSVTANPADASDKTVMWESSDVSFTTLNEDNI